MRKDTVFRGCTRPAMLLGVPILPLFVGAGSCLLLAAWFNLFWLLALPPVVFSLQLMVRYDDMVFRLLGIRWLFRLRVRQRALHGGMWVFSPLEPRQPE